MKKIIVCLLVVIISLTLLTGCGIGYNKQIFDLNYRFNYAIVSLMNGELVEGPISSWKDYQDSDMVQIIFTDGNIYYTHSSNVLLIFDPKGE